MTLEDLGNLGELIAAIATIATLVYLALQIRQNSESVKLNAGQSILASFNEALQMASSSPQTARVLILGQTDFDSLPEDEKAQFIVWIFAWFRVLEQGFYYHRKGLLDDEVWLGHVEHLRQIIGSPAVRHWWENRCSFFSTSFRKLVEETAAHETSALSPRGLLETVGSE